VPSIDVPWGARDPKNPSGPRVGIHSLGKPGLHPGWLGQESEHRFGCRIDADLKPKLLAATIGHFVVFFRSTASAACFSLRSRGRQNPSMNSMRSAKPSGRTA